MWPSRNGEAAPLNFPYVTKNKYRRPTLSQSSYVIIYFSIFNTSANILCFEIRKFIHTFMILVKEQDF
jgi:hypothetical protein